jgi:serine/threonine protein kinase
MTQSGLIAGTPHYMAPEQSRGDATDHRADLFSLGSTLYAMCAGYPPFRAETPLAVLRRVSDDTPSPLRQVNPEIPEWLEAIVEKLHSKDPARRFASASELAALLGGCLAHVQSPLTAALPSGLVSSARRVRTRRRRTAASVLGFAAILGTAIVFRPDHTPGPHAPPQLGRVAPSIEQVEGPVPGGPDEIDQAARDAWRQSGSIEADLHRRADAGGPDAVSDIARRLADRVNILEREIGSGRDAASTPWHP